MIPRARSAGCVSGSAMRELREGQPGLPWRAAVVRIEEPSGPWSSSVMSAGQVLCVCHHSPSLQAREGMSPAQGQACSGFSFRVTAEVGQTSWLRGHRWLVQTHVRIHQGCWSHLWDVEFVPSQPQFTPQLNLAHEGAWRTRPLPGPPSGCPSGTSPPYVLEPFSWVWSAQPVCGSALGFLFKPGPDVSSYSPPHFLSGLGHIPLSPVPVSPLVQWACVGDTEHR